MGVLYVVATPIGNMEDLSPRAQRILGSVSLIAAEDTRHTGAMLRRLGIETPLLSNHGFNERARVERLLTALAGGDVALVSDAGTPAISDPGAILVLAAAGAGYDVIPIPGPSALTAAVSASGLIDGPFTFLGFLPRPPGQRSAVLATALNTGIPLVLYESGNRIRALTELIAESAPARQLAIFRELTKLHEQAFRGSAALISEQLATSTLKGEFVVVIGAGAETQAIDLDALIQQGLDEGRKPSELAKAIARDSGLVRSEIYAHILVHARSRQEA